MIKPKFGAIVNFTWMVFLIYICEVFLFFFYNEHELIFHFNFCNHNKISYALKI